ncbi:MAG: glycosyltransferase family 39 protein [Candidatus Omnitrophota bacterium]
MGPFRNLDNFFTLVLTNPLPFYVIGRILVALIGACTVLPVYIITKNLYSKRAALMAALFMACTYLHVSDSHYCTVDIPMTFLLMLSYVFILKLTEKENLKNYIICGLLVGLAMATKYNAGVLIFSMATATFLSLSRKNSVVQNLHIIRALIVAYMVTTLTFFIFCSYIIFDFPGSWKAWQVLVTLGKNMNVGIWHRFSVDLFYGIGLPLEIFGISGFVYLIRRRRKKDIVFILFPIIYLIGIRKVGQPFARYSMPLVPFFVIAAALFLEVIYDKIKLNQFYKKILLSCLIVVMLLMPLAKSFYADYLFSKPDIRNLAKEWIYKNIPYGSGIAVDNPQYAPFLYATKAQLQNKINFIKDNDKGTEAKRKRLQLLLNLKTYPIENYRVYYFGTTPAEFSMHTPVVTYSKEDIFSNGIEYIITNDFSEQENKTFYENIRKDIILIHEFNALKDKKLDYSKYPYSYLPIDDTLFNLRYNGINIKIYKVK